MGKLKSEITISILTLLAITISLLYINFTNPSIRDTLPSIDEAKDICEEQKCYEKYGEKDCSNIDKMYRVTNEMFINIEFINNQTSLRYLSCVEQFKWRCNC